MASNLFDSLALQLTSSMTRALEMSPWSAFTTSSSSLVVSGSSNITHWSFTASNPIYSTIALDSHDNSYIVDQQGVVYRLDINGALKWTSNVGGSISAPVVFKDTLFVSSIDSYLYSLNTNEGSLLWQFDCQSPLYGSPVVDNNVNVYVASQSVFSLSPTGSLQWSVSPSPVSGAYYVGAPVLNPDQESLYAASNDGNLYALSTVTGASKWAAPITNTANAIVAAPIVDESGTIFVVVAGQEVVALWQDGERKFSVKLPTRASVAYYPARDIFYAGGLNNIMYATSAMDGASSWLTPSTSAFDSAPAVGPDGSVFASGTDGRLQAFNSAGSPLWTYNTGNVVPPNSDVTFASSPVVRSDGVVVVGSSTGHVYAIGTPYKPASYAVPSAMPPLLTGTNAIVFGTVFSSTFVLAFLIFYTYRLCKRRRGIFFIDGKFRGGRRSIILNPLRLRKPIISNISVPSVSRMSASPRSQYKRTSVSTPSPPKSAVPDQFGAFSVDMSAMAFSPTRQLKYDSTVVIDNGASCMRVGFSADEFPESIFPNAVSIDQTANHVRYFDT